MGNKPEGATALGEKVTGTDRKVTELTIPQHGFS